METEKTGIEFENLPRTGELVDLRKEKAGLLQVLEMQTNRLSKWINDGHVSKEKEEDKYPDKPMIPNTSRRLLTEDPKFGDHILRGFEAFQRDRDRLQRLTTEIQNKGTNTAKS